MGDTIMEAPKGRSDAYKAGWNAHAAGLSQSDNPHDRSAASWLADDWREGYAGAEAVASRPSFGNPVVDMLAAPLALAMHDAKRLPQHADPLTHPDGSPVTVNSIDVARYFGQPHAKAKRIIRRLLKDDEEKDWARPRADGSFVLTFPGFSRLVHRLNGKRAAQFSVAWAQLLSEISSAARAGNMDQRRDEIDAWKQCVVAWYTMPEPPPQSPSFRGVP
jgi:hypothetical protein